MQRTTAVLCGAVLWVLLVLVIVVEVPVALAWDPAYDPVSLTVSDLGATACAVLDYPSGPVEVCSPRHALMNTATILGGLAIAVGGVLLRQLAPAGRRRTGFVVLLLLTGASWVGTGLVPVDHDLTLHAVVALPAFVTQSAALLLVDRGVATRPRRLLRIARWVGIFGLVAATATVLAQPLGLPLGLVERIALYPVVLWYVSVGGSLLIGSARAPNR